MGGCRTSCEGVNKCQNVSIPVPLGVPFRAVQRSSMSGSAAYRQRIPKAEWSGVVELPAASSSVVEAEPAHSPHSSRPAVARSPAPQNPVVLEPHLGLLGNVGGAGPGGVLAGWLHSLLRLTPHSGAVPPRGGGLLCALPPLSDPLWRRGDLGEQVHTVLSTLQRERALLLAQLRAHRGAAQQRAATTANAAATAPAGGADAALQRALDAQARVARDREAKLQAEIDSVMLAGVEALEAKNSTSAEAERLTREVQGLREQLEGERAAHRARMQEMCAELTAAQDLSRRAVDQGPATAAMAAEVARLQLSLGRAQGRLQAAEDRSRVDRAHASSAEAALHEAEREAQAARAELLRCAPERRAEAEAAAAREQAARHAAREAQQEVALLRDQMAQAQLRHTGAASSNATTATPTNGALPPDLIALMADKEAEVLAAVEETELMAAALSALQDALDECTAQLDAHRQGASNAQNGLADAAAALQDAADRERALQACVQAEKDAACQVIAALREECEALLTGADADALAGGGSPCRVGVSGSKENPFDRQLRVAVHAQNKAKFEKIKAERNALRAELAERDVTLRRAQELAALQAAVVATPLVATRQQPPPAKLSAAAAALRRN